MLYLSFYDVISVFFDQGLKMEDGGYRRVRRLKAAFVCIWT